MKYTFESLFFLPLLFNIQLETQSPLLQFLTPPRSRHAHCLRPLVGPLATYIAGPAPIHLGLPAAYHLNLTCTSLAFTFIFKIPPSIVLLCLYSEQF